MLHTQQRNDQVVRISFFWLLLGAIFVVLLGMLGGLLAEQIWPPASVLPPNKQDQLVTNVQEITISPNIAASETFKNADRSVIALVKNNPSADYLATGVVVTNDGLVVTAATLPNTPIAAIDYRGIQLELDTVGHDQLFGLSYFRLKKDMLSPLDLRSEEVPLAYELLAVSRANITYLPMALPFQVTENIITPPLNPAGLQRFIKGPAYNNPTLAGSALIDDNGQLAGLLSNPSVGFAIPSDHLLASIRRIAAGQREKDPFAEIGFSVNYTFLVNQEKNDRQFLAEVTNVNPQAAASQADLRQGDLITGVNNQPLSWHQSLVALLSAEKLTSLTVLRGEQELTLPLTK